MRLDVLAILWTQVYGDQIVRVRAVDDGGVTVDSGWPLQVGDRGHVCFVYDHGAIVESDEAPRAAAASVTEMIADVELVMAHELEPIGYTGHRYRFRILGWSPIDGVIIGTPPPVN